MWKKRERGSGVAVMSKTRRAKEERGRGGGEDTHTQKNPFSHGGVPNTKSQHVTYESHLCSVASARWLLAQRNTHTHTHLHTHTHTYTFTSGEVRELGSGCLFFYYYYYHIIIIIIFPPSHPGSIETAFSSFSFQNNQFRLCPCCFFLLFSFVFLY